ncbi:hypothetical protein MMC30_007941 [Trapelia coarctata]|nr:hypothetical protein [Trapelia coarctata]
MATALSTLSMLPAELRCQIWKWVLTRDTPICASPGIGPKPHAAILTTCRQIRQEALHIFYESSTFTVLIHQSKRKPWGMKIARSGRKMIKSARIEVMIDHQGPTTAFLQNVAKSIYWIRSIGPSLEKLHIAVYEGDEHKADDTWMPGVRNEVITKFLNVAVSPLTMVIPTRLLSKLGLDFTGTPCTEKQLKKRFEALVKIVGGGEEGVISMGKRSIVIKGRGKNPGWGELLLRSGGA